MPQYTYPMPKGELTLPVLLALGGTQSHELLAVRQEFPSPVWGTGVLDTGTNVTCVAVSLLQKLGAVAGQQATSQTAAGKLVADIYEISLSIPAAGLMPGPMLTRGNLLVMAMTEELEGVDVLIGLDVLLQCRLLLDGPARQFTLEFQE